jgi:two-component system nitrate/nitrite response regulator NarL
VNELSLERVLTDEAAASRLLLDLDAVACLIGGADRGDLVERLAAEVERALPRARAVRREALGVLAQPGLAPRPQRERDAPITCLLADDHPIVTESISEVLRRSGLEVVARVEDGEAAVAEILRLRPAVALVDLRLPGLDGGEVARRTTRRAPETAVVLYTGADPVLLSSALESGARGFLLKEAPVSDLARAVKMVAGGGVYIDPALAAFLVGSPAGRALTRQELELLRLLAEGCTNEAIGKRLYLSPETVRTHVRRLMAKLDVHTRTAAVATALRERLIA